MDALYVINDRRAESIDPFTSLWRFEDLVDWYSSYLEERKEYPSMPMIEKKTAALFLTSFSLRRICSYPISKRYKSSFLKRKELSLVRNDINSVRF